MQPNDTNQPQPSAEPVSQAGAVSTADVAAAGDAGAARVQTPQRTESPETLFPADQTGVFRERWTKIQAGFVDEPRQAVMQADTLVAEVIQKLAASFAEERSRLEKQWDTGDDVSTEDLRMAVRRYRAFFDKLLSL